MIRNHFKSTLRALAKNKSYSLLNIFGLALGIAAFLFIEQYISYEKSYDKFHANHENLYRIQHKAYENGQLQVDAATSAPRVGSYMKEKMTEVLSFAKTYSLSGVISANGTDYRENSIYFAEPSFLKIFDFPLVHGDMNNVLNEPVQIVISERMAKRYFGKTDVIGEVLSLDSWINVKITGVAQDVPNNSHFKFDFLISFETLNRMSRDEDGSIASKDSWDWNSFYTYILLKDGTDPDEFNIKFDKVLLDERAAIFEGNGQVDKFPLQPITDIHLNSNLDREADPENQGDGQAVLFLTLIEFFILIIAWINYINLSTARAVERAKEVGVRKTMGANQNQLIAQFLTESYVLNLLALIVGLLMFFLGTYLFNQLTESVLTIHLLNPSFLLITTGVFVTGASLSGLYPAFILSSFKPVSVLKGRIAGNKSSVGIRKGLIVFQFIVSVSLIAGTIIVFKQLAHMREVELGFNLANTLIIKGPSILGDELQYPSSLEAFKNDLLKNKEIQSVTASSSIPGEEIIWTNGIKRSKESNDKMKDIYFAGIDYDYFTTYDITLLAGRDFNKSYRTDTGAVILNHAAARLLGFLDDEDAINKKVILYGDPKTVVGIVDNYKQMSAKNTVPPIVFPLALDNSYYFTLKLKTGNYQEALKFSQKSFNQFFPKNPFDYFILDQFFNRLYESDEQFSSVFSLFAMFAVIVACLGLFGLSSFSALQRTKEIGIRKTLGASMGSILIILTKEFMILIGIANIIAWPIIYLVMNGWLDNFASRISIGLWVFPMAGILLLIIALITVGFKTIKTAKSNPIEALRYE